MQLEDALQFIGDEADRNGADSWDALAGESESIGLELFESKVKSTEISNSRGIGIRLFKNGRPGFAFTERLTREALSQTVADAISHAKLTDPLDIDLPGPSVLPDIDLEPWNNELESIDLDRMKTLGLELESRALEKDSRVENVPYLGVGRSSGRGLIRNSKGIDYSSRHNSISAGLGVVSALDGNKKMGVCSRAGRSWSVFDSREMADLAVSRSVELLGAEPLPSGSYPIVFSNRVSGQILTMFTSPFFAESVQKGQSRLEGKVDERIAWEGFHLLNEPHRPDLPGSRLFDGEGVVTSPMEIIRDGVLKTYLYNLEAAKRAEHVPTGNGARGYSGNAGTGFANYVVPLGSDTLEQLLSRNPKCFLVVKLEGGSGCSATSGEISIGAQGFLYENGRCVRPVDRVTLSSNYFDLLPNIRGLSSGYNELFSSVKVPDILVDSMYVAG